MKAAALVLSVKLLLWAGDSRRMERPGEDVAAEDWNRAENAKGCENSSEARSVVLAAFNSGLVE